MSLGERPYPLGQEKPLRPILSHGKSGIGGGGERGLVRVEQRSDRCCWMSPKVDPTYANNDAGGVAMAWSVAISLFCPNPIAITMMPAALTVWAVAIAACYTQLRVRKKVVLHNYESDHERKKSLS